MKGATVKWNPFARNNTAGFVSVLLFLLGWQLLSISGFTNEKLFPPPTQVSMALLTWLYSGDFGSDLLSSLWRVVAGFGLGALLGVAFGLATGRIEKANKVLNPLFQMFRPLPPVAIIPLIIVWFGIGDAAKIVSISFAVFFPVWINVHLGASSIPLPYSWSASLLSHSKYKIFRQVYLPATLPSVVAGCRTAIATAFVMVYVSELAGASEGLGYRISINHLAYKIDHMMAALIVLAAVGALADFAFTRSMHSLFPWLKLNAQK